MSDANQAMTIDNITNDSFVKFPHIKKILNPEHEDIRKLMNEAMMSAGVACQHCDVKETGTTSPWHKFYKGIWEQALAALEPPAGGTPACLKKRKMFHNILPKLREKHLQSMEEGVESLPSFKVGTNVVDEHDAMMDKTNDVKPKKKEHKLELQKKKEATASSKGLGLQNVKNMNNILTPPKVLLHATNLTLGDSPTTASASKAKSSPNQANGSTMTSTSTDNVFTPIQTSMSNMESLLKSANNQLFDFANESSCSMTEKSDTIEACDLKRKLHAARESHAFSKESGNECRMKKKQALCEKLEDLIESSCREEKED